MPPTTYKDPLTLAHDVERFRRNVAAQLKELIDAGTVTIEDAIIEAMFVEAHSCLMGHSAARRELRSWKEAL
jgi:hypothetical protein